jgi:hypothetical protein
LSRSLVSISTKPCVQEERQTANDNTLAIRGLHLQIPLGPLRAHFAHARVKVRQCHGGSHDVFHGQRCLARYDSAGVLC